MLLLTTRLSLYMPYMVLVVTLLCVAILILLLLLLRKNSLQIRNIEDRISRIQSRTSNPTSFQGPRAIHDVSSQGTNSPEKKRKIKPVDWEY